ncbi:hypothetical protein BM477_03240 [Boudabousia marimammalium]|uniref:Uncharacterized protein n=1 Tax=Boudabousia marimammalium TaxID=156892 RepID=A0A1Q5PR11_9ACTO|nr:hypothetical protein BM477_03240 [Boudabousia marimammalium]
MWFRRNGHEQEEIDAEFRRLVENTEIDATLGGPRDYSLAEDPDDGKFMAPEPDPLPKLNSLRQVSIFLLIILIAGWAGLGIAQIVLPVWARVSVLVAGAVLFAVTLLPLGGKPFRKR